MMKRCSGLSAIERYGGLSRRKISNWCGSVHFEHKKFETPQTIDELQSVVKNNDKIRVLGSGHSFNDICNVKDGCLIQLIYMRNIIDFDPVDMTVTVEGGTTYGDLIKYIGPRGGALQNIPSLPHITIAGAISTATHASGKEHGNILNQIEEIEFCVGDGSLINYSRSDNKSDFNNVLVNLGCFGVITKIKLSIVPFFFTSSYSYDNIDFDTI
eukprot:UN31228